VGQVSIGVAPHKDYQDREGLRQAIELAVGHLGGFQSCGIQGRTVLLKPNLVRAIDPARGAVTHPAFVAEVARLCYAHGAARVQVGDSPAMGSAASVARAIGLDKELKAVDAEIIELKTPKVVDRGLDNGRFESLTFSREALEAQVLVNLPKPMAHCQMVMTCAVKNLYGCVPGRAKALRHLLVGNSRYLFARMLIDNARKINPALTIVDGVIAMDGQGPASGQPRAWGWILAGRDTVAIDRLIAEAFGYDSDAIPTLTAAFHMRYGTVRPDLIALHGATLEEMRLPDWVQARLHPISFNPLRVMASVIRHRFFR
jgi:uncharacterized protein (DUF362 family)